MDEDCDSRSWWTRYLISISWDAAGSLGLGFAIVMGFDSMCSPPPLRGGGSQLTTRYSIATWLRSALSARSSVTPTCAGRRRGRGDCARKARRGVDLVLKLEVDVPLAATDPVTPSPSSFKFGCATGTSTWLGSRCARRPPMRGGRLADNDSLFDCDWTEGCCARSWGLALGGAGATANPRSRFAPSDWNLKV